MLTKSILFQDIENNILTLDLQIISEKRKTVLNPLVDFIQQKKDNNQNVTINFICTHNSRRSHLAQVWAQVMANYFAVKNVFCYSGGTEVTALSSTVVKTLVKQGLRINTLSDSDNPLYSIKYADNEHPIVGFSKHFNDYFNPKSEFVAIMTCSQADEGCPFIAGAEKRIPITFEDPKIFDNTLVQQEKYLEASIQIATEMKYIFSLIK